MTNDELKRAATAMVNGRSTHCTKPRSIAAPYDESNICTGTLRYTGISVAGGTPAIVVRCSECDRFQEDEG